MTDDNDDITRIGLGTIIMDQGETLEPKESADNVISVSFGAKTTVKNRYADPAHCFHRKYVLDEESRTVECGACGKTVDAFKVLLEYAREADRWEHVRTRRRELSASVDALLEEEKRVKARTKAASRKDAQTAVAAERVKLADQRRRTAANARQIVELAQRIARASRDLGEATE